MPKSQRASVPTSVAQAALGATATSGCAPLSPPPLLARHLGAAPDAKGTVVIAPAAGIGDADVGGGFGVERRGSWQATEGPALGVAAGGAGGGDTSAGIAGRIEPSPATGGGRATVSAPPLGDAQGLAP